MDCTKCNWPLPETCRKCRQDELIEKERTGANQSEGGNKCSLIVPVKRSTSQSSVRRQSNTGTSKRGHKKCKKQLAM